MHKYHSTYRLYLELHEEAVTNGDSSLLVLADEIANPVFQSAWERVYKACDGNDEKLNGIELYNPKTNQWAAILIDPSEPSWYRAQYFAANGFHGHACHRSLEDVLDALIMEGFIKLDIGALERLSAFPEWSRGSEVLNIVQQLNAGAISRPAADLAVLMINQRYPSTAKGALWA